MVRNRSPFPNPHSGVHKRLRSSAWTRSLNEETKGPKGSGFARRRGFDNIVNPLTAAPFCLPLDLTRSGRRPIDTQEISEWREGRFHWRGCLAQ